MLNKLQAVVSKFEELCAKSEQPDFYADPKKAYEVLGWRAENGIEEMCFDLANWMKKNEKLYMKPIL